VTGDNAPPLDGWELPTRTFCARLIGDDHCDCPSCQIDEHAPPPNVTLGDE
jgi:hypothetical protein